MRIFIAAMVLLSLTACSQVWIYPTHLDQDCTKKARQHDSGSLRDFQDAYNKCLDDKGELTKDDEQWHDTYDYLNKWLETLLSMG